jgi:hypothetical protein
MLYCRSLAQISLSFLIDGNFIQFMQYAIAAWLGDESINLTRILLTSDIYLRRDTFPRVTP